MHGCVEHFLMSSHIILTMLYELALSSSVYSEDEEAGCPGSQSWKAV